MFPYIQPEQLALIPITGLAQSGAAIGAVPQWSGTSWQAAQPVLGLQNSTSIGRFAELNVTGNASLTRVGNRATLNVTGSTISVNGQPASILSFDNSFSVFNSGGNAFISAVGGANAGVNVNNIGPYNNIVFTGAGVSVSGNVINIPSGGVGGTGYTNWRVQTATAPFGTVLSEESITQNGVVRFIAGAGIGISQTSIGTGGTAFTLSATGGVGGSPTTLTDTGFGASIFFGAAPTYMMRGIRSLSPNLTVSGNSQTIDLNLVGLGSGGASSVNVFNNGNPIGAVGNINFVGFPSVINGGNIAVVTAPSGGGGTFGVNVNGSGPFTNLTFAGAGVSVAGSTITIPGSSGGGGSLAILNTGAFFMPAVTTLDIWGAASLQNLGGGLARLVLPSGGGGGGITGIQINNAGNYQNIIFNGAGVSVAGNTVTVFGATSGLTGVTANGLVIGTNTVQLNLANFSTPGAMPALNGSSTSYLAGDGIWRTVPSGSGGGGVTSVASGNAAVLQVTPTTGAVTVTPLGTTTSYTPTWDNATRTLGVHNFTSNGGILTSVGTTFLTIPSGGTSGITGISVNGLGNFSNINFSGAGVSVSGNTITIPGATSGITGISVNGGGSYTNVQFTGNVNVIGNTVNIPSFSGITSLVNGANTTAVNLGGGAWRVDASGGAGLPSGNTNDTFRYNGSAWEATNAIRINSSGNITFGNNARGLIFNNENAIFFGSWAGSPTGSTFSVVFGNSAASAFTPPRSDTFYVAGSGAGGGGAQITFEVNPNTRQIGFFGTVPISRPTTTPDIVSVRNALIALGLIQ